MKKKTIVVSGINLFSGGPLSIYIDFLSLIIKSEYDKKYNIIAFVHKKELFESFKDSMVRFIELPKSRKSYLNRIFYEYVYFYHYSKNKKIYMWISLHDMTPNVVAEKRIVYCHNPLPFFSIGFRQSLKYPLVALMKKLYYFAYKINVAKNDCIIVQQDWLRSEFSRKFGIENNKIAVCRPVLAQPVVSQFTDRESKNLFLFVYSAYPRFFKNYEVIAEAVKLLNERNLEKDYKVLFTINGKENKYSKELYRKYRHVNNIIWEGIVSREKMMEIYAQSDALIFPSIIETWGLPISEYKTTGKLMILADLPYAYETVEPYSNVAFFDPFSAKDLAHLMNDAITNCIAVENIRTKQYDAPYYEDWKRLLDEML
ncbi:MAG: glycosyltransferase [Lachnospiraceae bacterium]|nr:glycosyltransferase [Lachnospiraceae bacterium]